SRSGMTRPIRWVTSSAKSLASCSSLSPCCVCCGSTGRGSPVVVEQVVDAADCLVGGSLLGPQRVGDRTFAQLLIGHADGLEKLLATGHKIIATHPDRRRHRWTFLAGFGSIVEQAGFPLQHEDRTP